MGTRRRDGFDAARRLLAGAIASVLVIQIVAVAALSGGDGPRPPVRLSSKTSPAVAAAAEELGSCVEAAALSPDCLDPAVEIAAQQFGAAETMAALAEAARARPELEMYCHNIAHALGTQTFDEHDGTSVRALMVGSAAACGFGFMHGVLDAIGLARFGADDLLEVAEVCTDDALAVSGHCYDGIGHAAWSASEDLPTAGGVCQALPTLDAHELCVGGILMQMFEPARLNPTWPISEAPERLPGICASWPDNLPHGGEDHRQACWKGASYLYALTITDAHFHAGSPDIYDDLPRWQDLVRAAERTCAQFGPVGAAACAGQLGAHLGGNVSHFDEERAGALCGVLDDPAVVAECRRTSVSASVDRDGSLQAQTG